MEFMSIGHRDLLLRRHAFGWGNRGAMYIPKILPFIRELGCTKLLDYGCGQNKIKEQLATMAPDLEVASYDPAVPEYAALPQPTQFVVSTDVLTHVEEQYVPNVLKHICSLVQVGACLTIGIAPSRRALPEDLRVHVTVRPTSWWMPKIEALPWIVVKVDSGKKTLIVRLKK